MQAHQKSPRVVKRIRRTSTARAKQVAQYRKLKADFLLANPICFACKKVVSEGYRYLHHVFGRRGRLLCWTPGFRTVHFDCHEWIHHNPNRAQMLGLLGPMGTFNDYNRAVAHYEANR